ncbi:fungal-specific transcription factor domain-containing protein [Hypoxylon sp. NC1633]|nr:fungal-specific transcription factor domain-containing protein [Hypoxylon sp. NC1633]
MVQSGRPHYCNQLKVYRSNLHSMLLCRFLVYAARKEISSRLGFVCEYNAGIKWSSIRTIGSVTKEHEKSGQPQPSAQSFASSDDTVVQPKTPSLFPELPAPSSTVFSDIDEVTAYTYYVHRLAGDLQARDSLHNPYRRLAVLALNHPVLLRTIISCASEYMALNGLCSMQTAISQHTQAIQSIRTELSRQRSPGTTTISEAVSAGVDMSKDQALLSAILLQVAVVAFSSSAAASAQTHLTSAFHILNELGYLQTPRTMDLFVPKALVQRFAMVDMAVCAYHRRRPRVSLDTWFIQSEHHAALDGVQPLFVEMTGCSHIVFTFLVRVMHLAADVHECSRPKSDIYSDAFALETEMRLHDQENQQIIAMKASDAAAETCSIVLCRAFTHVAFLLLFRRVFAEPTPSVRVQHSISSIFSCLKNVPVTPPNGASGTHLVASGVDSASGLPFYLAAREAVTVEDQDWIRKRHEQWRQVYPNPSRVRLMEVAEKIWQERRGSQDQVELRCEDVERSCEAYLF